MKKILAFFILVVLGFSHFFVVAQEYILFYGNGCSHCAKVEKFFDQNDVVKKYDVQQKEVYFDTDSRNEFMQYGEKLKIATEDLGIPFLVINNKEECSYIAGDEAIISFFQAKLAQDVTQGGGCTNPDCPHLDCAGTGCDHLNCDHKSLGTGIIKIDDTTEKDAKTLSQRLAFFSVMLPAALADSINPCAFAVILLLLGSILSKKGKRKTVIFSGLLFSLAVFGTYFLMGLGLFKALASTTNTTVLKIIVGILGLLVGLANLKDAIRYKKRFVMEVPPSRRPAMGKVIRKASSPLGAFFVGILVSLFLLPCSSGPYFTILGYLSSESKDLHARGYIYLFVYNLLFVLPMVFLTFLVGLGYRESQDLSKMKDKYSRHIHLVVGLLMLGLAIYIFATL